MPSPVKIIGNTVIDTGMEGISVDDVASVGAAVGEVSGNIVSGGTNNGILVKCPPTASCGGSSVANNHVSRTVGQGGGAGINVLGGAPGLVVRNNVAASNARFGFELQGTGLVIRDNTAMDNGDGTLNVSGFAVSGTAHEVRRNTAVGNVSDGIRLYGAGFAAVADNVARGNYNVGIVVTEGSTGLTLTRCTASENFLFGFFVDADAVNTTLTGCTGKFNKGYDLCNQNGSASIDGGTFGTTGCP